MEGTIVFLYVLFCWLVASWAGNKGRSKLAWFFVSALISPLWSALIMFFLPDQSEDNKIEQMKLTHVVCPDCRELILKEARVCKHCRCKLIPQ